MCLVADLVTIPIAGIRGVTGASAQPGRTLPTWTEQVPTTLRQVVAPGGVRNHLCGTG